MGSNMAEAHPVGFRFPLKARERGAKLIHVDPRFTRTSAMCDLYVPIRAGTDIAFLGGIVNYILEHDCWFEEYVKTYTNAPVIVHEGFRDTEDLDGLFSGFDPQTQNYDDTTWQYAGMETKGAAGSREQGANLGEAAGHGGAGSGLRPAQPPQGDYT